APEKRSLMECVKTPSAEFAAFDENARSVTARSSLPRTGGTTLSTPSAEGAVAGRSAAGSAKNARKIGAQSVRNDRSSGRPSRPGSVDASTDLYVGTQFSSVIPNADAVMKD